MSRLVDKLPAPAESRPMKIVGLGASRTGTVGLWMALKTLGYQPFHISELLFQAPKMRALKEAIDANKSERPFGRPEFDKLFGGYDCVIESPCYLCPSIIEAYMDNPDVKFILTYRSPGSWAKSISGSLGAYHVKLSKQPLAMAKYFDSFIDNLSAMFGSMLYRWSGGLEPGEPGFSQALENNYIAYNTRVKAIVPPERLLVLDLDEGFGWEEICEFLGVDEVPEEPYPRVNAMADFHVAAEKFVGPAVQKTNRILAAIGSTAIAAAAIGVWYLQRRR